MCRPVVYCWRARNGSKVADVASSVTANSHVNAARVVDLR